jgi:hypothetical protein
MKDFNLIELYGMRKRILKSGILEDLLPEINEAIQIKESELLENTSATGGISAGGMGAVVSGQPAGLAGATIGTNWASGGGTMGSGDVSIPYNPSGTNRVFQKMPAPMGKEHGPRTGKKSRTKRLDIKTLKNMLSKTQDYQDGQGERSPDKPQNQPTSKEKRVVNFNDFLRNDFNTIKK